MNKFFVTKIFDWLRISHPNWYAILISIGIIFWIEGIMGLIDHYLIIKKPYCYFLILFIGLSILYLNDGLLSELYYVGDVDTNNIMIPGVVKAHRSM